MEQFKPETIPNKSENLQRIEDVISSARESVARERKERPENSWTACAITPISAIVGAIEEARQNTEISRMGHEKLINQCNLLTGVINSWRENHQGAATMIGVELKDLNPDPGEEEFYFGELEVIREMCKEAFENKE